MRSHLLFSIAAVVSMLCLAGVCDAQEMTASQILGKIDDVAYSKSSKGVMSQVVTTPGGERDQQDAGEENQGQLDLMNSRLSLLVVFELLAGQLRRSQIAVGEDARQPDDVRRNRLHVTRHVPGEVRPV